MIYFINFMLVIGFVSSFANFINDQIPKPKLKERIVYGMVAISFLFLLIYANLIIPA